GGRDGFPSRPPASRLGPARGHWRDVIRAANPLAWRSPVAATNQLRRHPHVPPAGRLGWRPHVPTRSGDPCITLRVIDFPPTELLSPHQNPRAHDYLLA